MTRVVCGLIPQDAEGSGTHSLSHAEWMALIGSVQETIRPDNAAEQPESVRRILGWTRYYLATTADPCNPVLSRRGFDLPRKPFRLR